MVEENARCGVQAVRFAVVGNQPKSSGFGDRVRTARPKRGVFHRSAWIGIPVTFAGAGVIKTRRLAQKPDALEYIQRARDYAVQGLNGLPERQSDGTLSRQIVNLIRLDFAQQ